MSNVEKKVPKNAPLKIEDATLTVAGVKEPTGHSENSAATSPLELTRPDNATPPAETLDIAGLRLSQDFAARASARKEFTSIRVGKPNPHGFIRVHPSPEWQLAAAVLMLKEEQEETYLVNQSLMDSLDSLTYPAVIYTVMSRQQVPSLWPVRMPTADGRNNSWADSRWAAAQLAMTRWVSVRSNMAAGAYDAVVANATIPDPVWPDVAFERLLELGFKGRIITSLDHPVLRRLRGEV